MFARDLYGILKTSASDFRFDLIKSEMLQSGLVQSTRVVAAVSTDQSDDGSFAVSYLVTASGFYSIRGTLSQAGGLDATFYNSLTFQMLPSTNDSTGKVLGSVPPVVCAFVSWDVVESPSAQACVRRALTGFKQLSARYAGFIQPLFSETYTLSLISADSATVYVDGLRILNKTSSTSVQVDGTISLQAMTLYPVLVEFIREDSAGSAAVLKWKSRSQILEVLSSNRM